MLDHTNNALSILYNNAQLGIVFGIFLIALVPMVAWADTFDVDFGGMDYVIEYTAVDIDIDDMYIDESTKSLILEVEVSDNEGMIDITIERSLLDSTQDGEDLGYNVVIDGVAADVRESSSTELSRTLSITVPSGSMNVEIIGNVLANGNVEPIDAEPIDAETPEPVEPIEPITSIDAETPEPVEPIEPIADGCGPGTILQDGVCVIDESVPDEPIADGCGPGTILQDGVCVIDESVPDEPIADGCGPGTILQDGVCIIDESVVDEPPKKTTTNMSIVISVAFAFMIAGGVAAVLALVAKASKKR